jgi:hypothetical protein
MQGIRIVDAGNAACVGLTAGLAALMSIRELIMATSAAFNTRYKLAISNITLGADSTFQTDRASQAPREKDMTGQTCAFSIRKQVQGSITTNGCRKLPSSLTDGTLAGVWAHEAASRTTSASITSIREGIFLPVAAGGT